ncbi:heterokaryon incompatibility protein-domain-containing protein [Apiospora sp. TS-2023a]
MPSTNQSRKDEAATNVRNESDASTSKIFKIPLRYAQNKIDTAERGCKEFLEGRVSEEYQYPTSPLGPQRIRLLRIEPGNRNEVLRCSLRVVRLGDRPEYIALSYAWTKDPPIINMPLNSTLDVAQTALLHRETRDEQDNKGINAKPEPKQKKKRVFGKNFILCNGKEMRIWENLYDALLQLRATQPLGEYWIDAVCIDQDNDEEKTIQVKMMDQIYSGARRVWSTLKVDYEAKFIEVLVNLAACLLSRPNSTYILSLAGLFRDPGSVGIDMLDMILRRNMARRANALEDQEKPIAPETLPSWMPNPASRNSLVLRTFDQQGGSNFAACSQMSVAPRMSFDGTILYLQGAKFDTITTLGADLSIVDTFPKVGQIGMVAFNPVHLVALISKMPLIYQPTDSSTLSAVASILVGGTWRGESPPPLETTLAFCYWFDDHVESILKTLTERDEKTDKILGKLLMMPDYSGYTSIAEVKSAQKLLRDLYQPWPRESEFTEAHGQAMTWRKVFITSNGFLGIGPRLMTEGDVVMLVKGGYVPYVFRHADAEVKRRFTETQRRLLRARKAKDSWMANRLTNDGKAADKVRDLEQKLVELKAWIESGQTSDQWVLIGEAYVEGIMNGEAVTGSMFQDIEII